jgi:hypothetical protein
MIILPLTTKTIKKEKKELRQRLKEVKEKGQRRKKKKVFILESIRIILNHISHPRNNEKEAQEH